MSFKVKTLRKP